MRQVLLAILLVATFVFASDEIISAPSSAVDAAPAPIVAAAASQSDSSVSAAEPAPAAVEAPQASSVAADSAVADSPVAAASDGVSSDTAISSASDSAPSKYIPVTISGTPVPIASVSADVATQDLVATASPTAIVPAACITISSANSGSLATRCGCKLYTLSTSSSGGIAVRVISCTGLGVSFACDRPVTTALYSQIQAELCTTQKPVQETEAPAIAGGSSGGCQPGHCPSDFPIQTGEGESQIQSLETTGGAESKVIQEFMVFAPAGVVSGHEFQVKISSKESGKPLAGVYVRVLKDGNMISFPQTDSNGMVTVISNSEGSVYTYEGLMRGWNQYNNPATKILASPVETKTGEAAPTAGTTTGFFTASNNSWLIGLLILGVLAFAGYMRFAPKKG